MAAQRPRLKMADYIDDPLMRWWLDDDLDHEYGKFNGLDNDVGKLSIAPLVHEHGKFNGWDKHDTVEALDELNGYDEAIEGQCKVMNGCQCDDASGRAAASLLGRR